MSPEPHWAGGGGGQSQAGAGAPAYASVSVALTQAQLRAMSSTPIVVLPGMAGEVHWPTFCLLKFVGGEGFESAFVRFGWTFSGFNAAFNDSSIELAPSVTTVCQTTVGATTTGVVGADIRVKFNSDPSDIVGTATVALQYVVL